MRSSSPSGSLASSSLVLTANSQLATVGRGLRSNMEATHSVFDIRRRMRFANLSQISATNSGIVIGFTRISSACKTMASIVTF